MNSPAVPERPERGQLRASDADRERVAEILREAAGEGRLTLEELDERLDAVYASKTYADLEPVTRDLPAGQRPGAGAPVGGPRGGLGGEQPPIRGFEKGRSPFGEQKSAVAIMGGCCRKGDWVVPRQYSAFALMGGIEIDMRDARFSEPTVTIHAVTIMGGIEVTVPDDATVRVTGIGVMGGFDHGATRTGAPGGPTIIVDGLALMGGVEIKRKRRTAGLPALPTCGRRRRRPVPCR